MLAHEYATQIPPHVRVGRFVADEPRLSWVFPLLRTTPQAEVYVVGGTVRDAVLGKEPRHVHIVVRNVEKNRLKEKLGRFGLVQEESTGSFSLTPTQGSTPIGVALPRTSFWDAQNRTLRSSANPYLPLAHDLARRDFTVNAIGYSVNSGLMVDPFDGLKDLQTHQLASIGNPANRFSEDPLLTLRGLRLAAEHGFAIQDATWGALTKRLPSVNRITTAEDGTAAYAIPRAAVGREFLKNIRVGTPHALELWEASGASRLLTPEISELENIVHPDGQSAREKTQTLLAAMRKHLPHREITTSLTLAGLLALLEDAAPQTFRNLTVRLHLHDHDLEDFNHEHTAWMLQNADVLQAHDPKTMRPSDYEHYFGGQRGTMMMHLLHTMHMALGTHTTSRERLHAAKRRGLVLASGAQKLIRGRDLETMGLNPGPHYRHVLKKIRDAQMMGDVENREEALAYARHLITQMA